ncbi:MAG: NADH-quinone oxidoreductase subunit I [Deltaproteobacteria bacterium]|nr:NADH-quinone oxidoreductase subunit I [Deltaproteobacteria bacterium]MBI2500189.1 NADH-quinone oxidoreductase subunit I [Deltaproteobacteria bacterium]
MEAKVKVLYQRPMTFWERSYLFPIVTGLWTTLKHLLKNLLRIEKIATYEYPEQPKPIPDGYRAEHRLMKRPDESVRCTACMLCATACPADCIEIVAAENPDPKIEKYPVVYNINLLRCVFCGLCVEACPCDAVRMDTKKVDMAGYSREEFILDIDYLLNNHPNGMDSHSIAP